MRDDKKFTPEERDAYLDEEAKKLKIGDRIEIRRDLTRYPVDDDPDNPWPQPDYKWEMVEITDILPPPPAGNVVVEVKYADGTTRVVPLVIRWRRLAN